MNKRVLKKAFCIFLSHRLSIKRTQLLNNLFFSISSLDISKNIDDMKDTVYLFIERNMNRTNQLKYPLFVKISEKNLITINFTHTYKVRYDR